MHWLLDDVDQNKRHILQLIVFEVDALCSDDTASRLANKILMLIDLVGIERWNALVGIRNAFGDHAFYEALYQTLNGEKLAPADLPSDFGQSPLS